MGVLFLVSMRRKCCAFSAKPDGAPTDDHDNDDDKNDDGPTDDVVDNGTFEDMDAMEEAEYLGPHNVDTHDWREDEDEAMYGYGSDENMYFPYSD